MKKKTVHLLVFNNFKNDSRVLKEAISLDKSGYKVEVIAHHDDITKKTEKLDNITVKRVSYLDRKSAGTLQKIKAYLRFLFIAIKLTKKSDIIHCNDLNTLPVAFICKTILRRKVSVIYDAHEYETEQDHLSGLAKKIARISEKTLIKSANQTITVSQSIAKEYKKNYPFIKHPKVILNCPAYQKVNKKNLFRERFNIPESSNIFLYQGNLSRGRGIDIIIKAFEKVPDKNNVIIFMGYGDLEDRIKEASKKENNIFFHEAAPSHKLLDYTSSADFGFSTIENSCLSFYFCLPNKLFEYMMAEVPVIVSNLPEMKQLVSENNTGLVIEHNTPDGIIEAVNKIVTLDKQTLKDNLNAVNKKYNWQVQEKKLLEIYNTL